MVALGIAKTLSLDPAKPVDEEAIHKIENHLIELEEPEHIPHGLHAFGRTPTKELRDSTVDAIVSADRSLLPKNAKVLAAENGRAHRPVGAARARQRWRADCAAAICTGGGGGEH